MVIVEDATVFGFNEFAFLLLFRFYLDLKILVFDQDIHHPVADLLDFVVGCFDKIFPKPSD
jgi:hypothetical protein